MTNAPALIVMTAPAKVNLFLHVTGKRDNGYHTLQSLICFADKGDSIKLEPAENFSLSFTDQNTDLDPDDNLITKAVTAISNHTGKKPDFKIEITKDIPVGAGLGGGSSNATATIKAALRHWNIDIAEKELNPLLLSLGADVPACYHGSACFVEGIGEIITPCEKPIHLHAVIIHPGKPCLTADVFQNLNTNFSEETNFTPDITDLVNIQNQRNDLYEPASQIVPEINEILGMLNNNQNCSLARMSGSGSACFGLFKDEESTDVFSKALQKEKPNWWVRPVILQ